MNDDITPLPPFPDEPSDWEKLRRRDLYVVVTALLLVQSATVLIAAWVVSYILAGDICGNR